jgi:arsenate reductase
MISVLFLCAHNPSLARIAEAYLSALGEDRFLAVSAGLKPGRLDPFVARALQEEGIDISGEKTPGVFDLHRDGGSYQYVITIGSKEGVESFPVFPGRPMKMYWSFPDPAAFHGTDAMVMAKVRIVRDEMKRTVRQFLEKIRTEEPPN